MQESQSRYRIMANMLMKLLPLFAFVVPITILYFLDPEFMKTWKGRIFYIFFLWLISLEIILSLEQLQTGKIKKTRSIRTAAFLTSLLLPIAYVVVSNFFGLNSIITNLALQRGIGSTWANVIPLSTEYLVFTALFALIVLLEYGTRGLKIHSISTLFLALIGAIYTIDNFLPGNNFQPFQIFVPTTSSLAANFLNILGYRTMWGPTSGNMPQLTAIGSHSFYPAIIAWPCSGIESLLIYAVIILLFLRNSAIPWKQGTIYFITGAAVTYFINVLRIVAIFIVGVNDGGNAADTFHNYYGQLFSIAWIVFYPLLILGSRAFLGKTGDMDTAAVEDGAD